MRKKDEREEKYRRKRQLQKIDI